MLLGEAVTEGVTSRTHKRVSEIGRQCEHYQRKWLPNTGKPGVADLNVRTTVRSMEGQEDQGGSGQRSFCPLGGFASLSGIGATGGRGEEEGHSLTCPFVCCLENMSVGSCSR